MTEQTNNRQLFLEKAEHSIEKLRNSLCVQIPTQLILIDSIQDVIALKNGAIGVELDSFRSITGRLEKMFLLHSTAQTIPDRIELEIFELAIDWLAQLAILYSKDLPEPKSLIAELIYAFDLVEHSQDATSLAELVAEHAEQVTIISSDPFSDDPVFAVEDRSAPSRQDPFTDDPGFGLEFDLLQRTLNLAPEAREIVADPFNEDPSLKVKRGNFSTAETVSEPQQLLYDLFDGDPPLSDKPDDRK